MKSFYDNGDQLITDGISDDSGINQKVSSKGRVVVNSKSELRRDVGSTF